MKTDRQAKILEIISSCDIETQNQLMDELARVGVSSTQATLSRDIKELRLVKEQTPDGIYRYVAAAREEYGNSDLRLRKIFKESVTAYETAQNLIVIRTLPGLANAAAAALDGMNIPDYVGSIAGDDTVFIAMKDNEAAEQLCREIRSLL